MIMFKKLALAIALTVGCSTIAMAQDATDSQKFRVRVPTSISITAPTDVEINHDESDNDQAFPSQDWVVKANVLGGVLVAFEAQSPFTHTVDNSFKRDAKLTLSLGATLGPAEWTVTQATDTTDYQAGGDSLKAAVTASSNGVGRATFGLAVEFITDNYGTFAAGDYESTIVGTVTAN